MMKIVEIIKQVEQWHAPVDHPHTVDTIKIGDTNQECTGIAITCFASVDVVRRSIEEGCNLIICHEPLFYGDQEENGISNNDPVFMAKRKLLEDAGIVVWRDHDHMHGPGGPGTEIHTEIDYIYYGIMKKLGWEQYRLGEETKPLLFQIPVTTVSDLTQELLVKLNLCGARIVGDQSAEVSTVYLCEHVMGRGDAKTIAKAVNVDVMIPLEIVDWTLSAYVRDSCQLNMPKAIIEMGHFNTEEIGMQYMLDWLPEVIGKEVPLRYIQSGDSFSYILRK